MEEFSFWNGLSYLWNFTLFNVEHQPVTIGKLIVGVVLLFLGYIAAKRITRQIESRLLNRFELEPSLRYTLSRLIFYSWLIILTLFVLHILSVPITIFAVVGGALAIGVGFGSQNIVNNFISGLIVMIERPIRVGDFVEVDGTAGYVESIGARSTLLRTLANTRYIVPNSQFLEKTVINWTLSDDVSRGKVEVGVAYGSDTRLVERLLLQIGSQHPKILKEPSPAVSFANFGESSLDFSLYFYIRASGVGEVRSVESDLRFQIEEQFRLSKINIPYPQRDLHLDSQRPIQVEVLR